MIYKLHKPSKIHSNGDGYITRSGHTMFNEDIVSELNRVKSLEAENTQLKAALTNIKTITDNNYDHDMLRIAKLAKGAMENPR